MATERALRKRSWLTPKNELVAARWEESSSPEEAGIAQSSSSHTRRASSKPILVPCRDIVCSLPFQRTSKTRVMKKAAQIKRAALGHSPPFCLYFSASFFARSDDAVSTSPEISRVSSFVSLPDAPFFPFPFGFGFWGDVFFEVIFYFRNLPSLPLRYHTASLRATCRDKIHITTKAVR